MNTQQWIYTVHTVRPDEVGAVEIVFPSEEQARSYAQDRSKDFRVLAASVSWFAIGLLGIRAAVAWFADGEEQDPRTNRPGPLYPADRGSRS